MRFANTGRVVFGVLFVAGTARGAGEVAKPRAIYGTDSRLDYYQIMDPKERLVAESTVALVPETHVTYSGNQALLASRTLQDFENLCPGDRFGLQPVAAFCSGALVADNVVITAGHCVNETYDCAHTALVFGFRMDDASSDPLSVPKSEVYHCRRVLYDHQDAHGADYAVLQLDRPVPNHRPLLINRGGVAVGESLLVYGHPSGVPLKQARGEVIGNDAAGYFDTNLDVFAGNSGSMVLNAKTLKIEGILVRGRQDYDYDTDRGCYSAVTYPQKPAWGEQATRITALPAVAAPPDEVTQLTVSNVAARKALLSWQPAVDGTPAIQYRIISVAANVDPADVPCKGGRVIAAKFHSLLVRNLRPNRSYNFAVCARARNRMTSEAVTVSFTTLPR